MLIIYIIFIFLQLLLGLFIFFLVITFVTGAPYVPTIRKTAERMIELAQLKKKQTIIDVGCGDGRLMFLAYQKGAISYGCDINIFLIIYVYLRSKIMGIHNNFYPKWQNLWNYKLSHADVVFVYLLPWNMNKLKSKILKECKKGTLIVTNSFLFEDWKIYKKDTTFHIYVYKV